MEKLINGDTSQPLTDWVFEKQRKEPRFSKVVCCKTHPLFFLAYLFLSNTTNQLLSNTTNY